MLCMIGISWCMSLPQELMPNPYLTVCIVWNIEVKVALSIFVEVEAPSFSNNLSPLSSSILTLLRNSLALSSLGCINLAERRPCGKNSWEEYRNCPKSVSGFLEGYYNCPVALEILSHFNILHPQSIYLLHILSLKCF